MTVKVTIKNDRPNHAWTKQDEIDLLCMVAHQVRGFSEDSPDGALYLRSLFLESVDPGGSTLVDWVTQKIMSDSDPDIYPSYVQTTRDLEDARTALATRNSQVVDEIERLEGEWQAKLDQAGAELISAVDQEQRKAAQVTDQLARQLHAMQEKIDALTRLLAAKEEQYEDTALEDRYTARSLSEISRIVVEAWMRQRDVAPDDIRDVIARGERAMAEERARVRAQRRHDAERAFREAEGEFLEQIDGDDEAEEA
jgi:hypothetical protein